VIQEEIKRLWGEECTTQEIAEITKAHIIPQTYLDREKFNNNLEYTCLENGVLNLVTGEMLPHSPDYKFTFRIPVEYDPEARCDKIHQFLSEITDEPEDIKTLLQIIGYSLYRGYPTAKVFVLLGSGRNGKSVFINMVKRFLGLENVRGLSMQQLEHDDYAKGFLYGKHANMNPDISNKRILTSGVIKKLTGGDTIDSNVKYGDYMMFKNFAKLIFAANDLPTSDDSTYAWLARWIFIKFPHRYDGEPCPICYETHPVNKNLEDELCEPGEMSGLLNAVIVALKNLQADNWDFTLSEKVRRMEKDYAILSDPVKGFIVDCIIENAESKILKGDVYDKYRVFCKEIGEEPLISSAFTTRFKQHMPGVDDTRGKGGRRFWVGVEIGEKGVQDILRDNPEGYAKLGDEVTR